MASGLCTWFCIPVVNIPLLWFVCVLRESQILQYDTATSQNIFPRYAETPKAHAFAMPKLHPTTS
eukprot:3412714-Amphidinium_carterae.1